MYEDNLVCFLYSLIPAAPKVDVIQETGRVKIVLTFMSYILSFDQAMKLAKYIAESEYCSAIIAIVDPKQHENTKFLQFYFRNRGIEAKVHISNEEALTWLAGYA